MESTFLIGIVNNITLLLVLGFLYSVSIRRWDIKTVKGQLIAGLLFGLVSMIGMVVPVQYSPGLIFDGRTILLGTVGLFGGGLAAAVAVVMTGLLRIWQGGVGLPMGLATILSASAIGVAFHYLRTKYAWVTKLIPLYFFGLLIHAMMLACTLFLPESFRWKVLADIALPVLLVYPVATMLYGRLIVGLEEHNDAADKLRDSQQLYQALAESSTAGIGLRDEAGRFAYVNKMLAMMLEAAEPSQLIGLNYIDFVHPEDREESLRRIRSNQIGEVASRREHRLVSLTGNVIWVESTGVPILRNDNKYIMGVFQDCTARRRMEQTLRENEERYRAVMQQSNESILLVDIETRRILEVNPHCVEAFGYSEAELLAMTTYDLVADTRENIDRRSDAISSGTGVNEQLIHIRCKNGKILDVERSATVIQYGGKHVFMFANRDISSERKLQGLILRDVAMAAGVQKDLLPRGFDDLLVSVETVYEPHHLVSGDFFDFAWSEDHKRLSGFILDVSGHGVSSALQCIAVSTYFRDILNSPMSLDARLKWVNRHVLRYFTHETFAAALGFEFDFSRRSLTFATAGIYGFLAESHALPRLVKRPGSLLGILDNPEYTEWTVPIKAGDAFYFMSDGLFDVVSRDADLPTADYKQAVRTLRDIAASPQRRDDCSAVCILINDQPRFPVRLEFHRYGEYNRIRSRIRDLLQNVSLQHAPRIEIAIGEALANALRESMDVRVKISLCGRRLMVRISDGGNGFDGKQRVATFRAVDMESEFLDRLYSEGGRGILIMLAWMDQVIYSRKGNEVLLVKNLEPVRTEVNRDGDPSAKQRC